MPHPNSREDAENQTLMPKITELTIIDSYFGLEGTFKGHLVQPSCNEQGHLQLDQVAQSPVQPDLEYFQGWGTYNLKP